MLDHGAQQRHPVREGSHQTSLGEATALLPLGAERLRTCLDFVRTFRPSTNDCPTGDVRLANHTFYRCFYLEDAATLNCAEDVKSLDRYAEAFDEIKHRYSLTFFGRWFE
jgi:hypothetical protein